MSSSFSDLSARAQWHQLAEALLEAATAGAAAGGSAAPESDARALYEAYVRPSEAHLCPLRTVQLAALAARACVRARPYVLGGASHICRGCSLPPCVCCVLRREILHARHRRSRPACCPACAQK